MHVVQRARIRCAAVVTLLATCQAACSHPPCNVPSRMHAAAPDLAPNSRPASIWVPGKVSRYAPQHPSFLCKHTFKPSRSSSTTQVGIDAGPVKAEINAVTGRVSYRGRAMNRAARIAAKAPAGQLWCSDDVWRSCCSSTAAVDGRASNNGNNRTSGSGGTAGRTSFTLTAAPRRNAGDISEGHTAGDELYDGRDRRSHVSQLGEYGRDSAVQKQYSVAGRYMGRHVLKGVSGPMDLWHCRWVWGCGQGVGPENVVAVCSHWR